MTRVTIQVVEKAEPAMGKKRGRIKDAQGLIYQIPPVLLQMTNVGSTYEIDYKDDEYNNNKFRVVESLIPALAHGGRIPGDGLPPPRVPPPSPQYPQTKSSGGMVPTDSETKTEDISVLAIIKCQQLPVGDRAGIFHALKASALAWRDFKKWQRTQDSDMDGDELP